jgi:hypothetical protein
VSPLKAHATEWEAERWSPLDLIYAWRDPPRVWSADHGDALGNFLERFQFELETRRAHYSGA